MKISDIRFDSRNVNIVGKVVKKEEPRTVTTRFGATVVANAMLEDETGSVILVLWGDEIDKVNEGDSVKIENGYIREFNGQLQLNVGKFGKLKVV